MTCLSHIPEDGSSPIVFYGLRAAVALKPFLQLYLTAKEVNIPNHHIAVNMEFVPCNLPPIHGRGLKVILNETKMKLNSLVLPY